MRNKTLRLFDGDAAYFSWRTSNEYN